MHRWIFGMYSRDTKLVVLYACKNRRLDRLHGYIKKHVAPYSAIFTDTSVIYCNIA